MNYLLINKFLHPNGGSETYIFELGKYLESLGHNVQYFGMEHEGRTVGNRVNAYTSDMDFHGGSILKKLTYPLKTIYSGEARRKLRQVLDDFKPDICHINNFNYQLTPSIILEIVKWRKKENKDCKIIHTAHDYQLICPNHMMYVDGMTCERCLGGKFGNCSKNKCIHGSRAKSIIGQLEASYWNGNKVYRYFDKIICPSRFLKEKLDSNPVLAGKTVAVHNFIKVNDERKLSEKEPYVLYFGRFSEEKGFGTLLTVANELKDVRFIFAGTGPLAGEIDKISNVKNMGFKSGEELKTLIKNAICSVYPSEWYENCPLSVLESISLGTPVIGSNIGGIPELIDDNKTGLLFEAGNKEMLSEKILMLWNDRQMVSKMQENCLNEKMMTLQVYLAKTGII